jgi:hypothetical protein
MDPIFAAIDLHNKLKAEFGEASAVHWTIFESMPDMAERHASKACSETWVASERACVAAWRSWDAMEATSPTTLAGFAAKLRALADEDIQEQSGDILQRLRADFDRLMPAAA